MLAGPDEVSLKRGALPMNSLYTILARLHRFLVAAALLAVAITATVYSSAQSPNRQIATRRSAILPFRDP